MFCRSALLLSFCENRLCLSQLKKKLNSTERGALFRHFCVSKVITTAHAHKSGVIFSFFPRAFKQKKIKALWPKMTKIASRGVLPYTAGPGVTKSHAHARKIAPAIWKFWNDFEFAVPFISGTRAMRKANFCFWDNGKGAWSCLEESWGRQLPFDTGHAVVCYSFRRVSLRSFLANGLRLVRFPCFLFELFFYSCRLLRKLQLFSSGLEGFVLPESRLCTAAEIFFTLQPTGFLGLFVRFIYGDSRDMDLSPKAGWGPLSHLWRKTERRTNAEDYVVDRVRVRRPRLWFGRQPGRRSSPSKEGKA